MENFDKQQLQKAILTPEQEKAMEEQIQKFDKKLLTKDQKEALAEFVKGNSEKFNAEIAKLEQQIKKRQGVFSEIEVYFRGIVAKEEKKRIKKEEKSRQLGKK